MLAPQTALAVFSNIRGKVFSPLTLKKRIVLIFLLSSFVPFLCISLISYYTISSILANKIEDGIMSNLRQVALSLENSLTNLSHISQQLAYAGTTVKELEELMNTEEPFQRLKLQHEFKSKMNLITFTNPDIGLTMYYFSKDHNYHFENLPVKYSFAPDKLPLFARYYGITYYGPHESFNRFDNKYVLSTMRKVDYPGRDDAYVYIESGFQLVKNLLDNSQSSNRLYHVILNSDGVITYSELPRLFRTGGKVTDLSMERAKGFKQGYYWFKQNSSQGWSVLSAIPEADFNREKRNWILQISLFSLVLLAMTFGLSWLMWKMVYRPLSRFQTEIKAFAVNEQPARPEQLKIPEFDALLRQFGQMRERIWELIDEIQDKEKQRVDLEVEKLLYQINPHFLMNTLDTAHWLALMNGQEEIDRLVQSLNKLLYYNLGKLGKASTIEEEIEAIRQYLTLQQIRYDFQFDVRIQVEDEVLRSEVPRFILQPLVENALYHGLNDEGFIRVEIRRHNGVEIAIHDNGAGMPPEKIERLLNRHNDEQQKVGMGIGMNYVLRTLDSRYEGRASIRIESEIGKGTSLYLTLPIEKVGEQNDKGAYR